MIRAGEIRFSQKKEQKCVYLLLILKRRQVKCYLGNSTAELKLKLMDFPSTFAFFFHQTCSAPAWELRPKFSTQDLHYEENFPVCSFVLRLMQIVKSHDDVR